MLRRQGDGAAIIRSGEILDVESGGALKIDGTDKTAAVAAGVTTPVAGVAAGYKLARGVLTTTGPTDTVVTGLATVVAVVASLETDPSDDPLLASATIGDQAGSPAAGSVIIKTWKTNGTDPTPSASATTGNKVHWVAIGT